MGCETNSYSPNSKNLAEKHDALGINVLYGKGLFSRKSLTR